MCRRTFLVVWWLKLGAAPAQGMVSILGNHDVHQDRKDST